MRDEKCPPPQVRGLHHLAAGAVRGPEGGKTSSSMTHNYYARQTSDHKNINGSRARNKCMNRFCFLLFKLSSPYFFQNWIIFAEQKRWQYLMNGSFSSQGGDILANSQFWKQGHQLHACHSRFKVFSKLGTRLSISVNFKTFFQDEVCCSWEVPICTPQKIWWVNISSSSFR